MRKLTNEQSYIVGVHLVAWASHPSRPYEHHLKWLLTTYGADWEYLERLRSLGAIQRLAAYCSRRISEAGNRLDRWLYVGLITAILLHSDAEGRGTLEWRDEAMRELMDALRQCRVPEKMHERTLAKVQDALMAEPRDRRAAIDEVNRAMIALAVFEPGVLAWVRRSWLRSAVRLWVRDRVAGIGDLLKITRDFNRKLRMAHPAVAATARRSRKRGAAATR